MVLKIHHTAEIDEGSIIGDGTKIWHWSHVSYLAKIGKDCSLGQNTYIGSNVIIGDNCKIQNNVSIYEGVIMEDNVFCGPSMVFTNVINPRSQINRKKEFKKTFVKKGATFGANCTIVCGITIGKYSLIGAGALVNKDVIPYSLVVGVPAKQIGWVSELGENLALPLEGNGIAMCKKTKIEYKLINGNLEVGKTNVT